MSGFGDHELSVGPPDAAAALRSCHRLAVDLLDLPQSPAAKRSARLAAWIDEQPSADEAARALTEDLRSLLDEDELGRFLVAENLWIPLTKLAGRTRGRAASTLWAWASIAASLTGAWADHATSFACRALESDPSDELAWREFERCASDEFIDPTLWESLDEWLSDPARRASLALPALRVLDRCSAHWPRERDVERLARLRARAENTLAR